jgi:hypothetical protein
VRPLSRQATRAGVTGVAAFGVALVALQGLQQAIGAFDPRVDITVAIVVAVSAGALTTDRVRTRHSERAELRERQQALGEATLAWDPPPLRDADPGDLGIFPPSAGRNHPADDAPDGEGDDPRWQPYVKRDIDPELRGALRSARFVLVYGAPRSGKTRTAAEAAREVLGDAPVLLPRGAEGLRVLFELQPRLEGEHAVLWLDSLERFAGVIDAKTLDWLGATHEPDRAVETAAYPGPPITVVATIREATWDRLLGADGEDGEFAKAVAARARAFRVPAALRRAERKAAKQLYPDAHPGRDAIGAALAASGKDEEPPLPSPARASEVASGASPEGGPGARTLQPLGARLAGLPRRVRESGDPWLLLPAGVCGLALLWFGASTAINGGIEKARQPTIGEQVADIRSEGAEGPRVSDKPNTVDLHGSGQDSWVFSFRDAGQRSQADEIQVWDVVGGDELERRFRFQPARPAVYQYRGAADINGDGDEELIGGYGPPAPTGELLVPFALDWNPDIREYRLVPLHPSPPNLDGRETPRLRRATAAYRERTKYSDGRGNSVRGFPTQDFAVIPEDRRLVSGYLISDPERGPASIAVEVEGFDAQAERPRVRDCNFPNDRPVVTRDDPGALIFNLLAEKWSAVSANRRCAPEYQP